MSRFIRIDDWDGDGKKDLVLGAGNYALGKSGGQLALPPLFDLQPGTSDPANVDEAVWLDVDGDGAKDIITGGPNGNLAPYSMTGGPNGKALTLPFDCFTQTLNGSVEDPVGRSQPRRLR